MTPRNPVISISGIPGSGKTRASRSLAARLEATYLSFDDFETLTERDAAHTMEWLKRGAPAHEMYDPTLDDILVALAELGPVVFETPLGRQLPAHSAVITCAIWLEVDRDIALARKLTHTLSPCDWSSAAEMSDWLGQFLSHYRQLVRPCLEMQAERVRPLSDYIVDGTMSCNAVDATIDQIVGVPKSDRQTLDLERA